MRKLLVFVLLLTGPPLAAQEEGHVHGPDGRHIVATPESGSTAAFILSHHDMRIEGADGKGVLGAKVFSTITKKGDPKAVVHKEDNVYEPENEVYGSHMSYSEPGEYVLDQQVRLPDGKDVRLQFPVWVPSVASPMATTQAPFPVWAAVAGGLGLLALGFLLGRRGRRAAGAAVVLLGAVAILPGGPALAGGEEDGHAHGPDGRHIVEPSGSDRPAVLLRAYPTADRGESAEQTVEGYRFVLSIENEETRPDPELLAIGEAKSDQIGLKVAMATLSSAAGGLEATGSVAANPNGTVLVNARASGRIVSLGAIPGTEVQRGQALAVIESPDLARAQADYHRATSDLAASRSAVTVAAEAVKVAEVQERVALGDLARQRELAKAGAFASPALESARAASSTARAESDQAAADVRTLRERVGRLERGVADGVVARRELDSGMADLASAEIAKTDADSRLLIANEALTREESIARKGLRTASEIQRAEGAAQVARANAASARSQLEGARAESIRAQNSLRVAASQVTLLGGAPGGGNRITVSAPIGGEVERRTVSAGQTVSAGEELYELLNAEVVWILCDVYEGDIARVRAGQQVTVTVDALKGSVYEGEVAFVHNEVDQTTRTTKVRIVVPNPGERLKQNMFARVRIGSAAGPRVLVPTESVQRVGGLDVVFVEEAPGTYRRTLVQTGGSLGGRTVLLAGVEAGERVVTDGSYQLASMGGGQ